MLHKLKILPEKRLDGELTWFVRLISNFVESYDLGIEDVAKIQLIRICLASTSFTKLIAVQKLWKFAEEDLLGKWS